MIAKFVLFLVSITLYRIQRPCLFRYLCCPRTLIEKKIHQYFDIAWLYCRGDYTWIKLETYYLTWEGSCSWWKSGICFWIHVDEDSKCNCIKCAVFLYLHWYYNCQRKSFYTFKCLVFIPANLTGWKLFPIIGIGFSYFII